MYPEVNTDTTVSGADVRVQIQGASEEEDALGEKLRPHGRSLSSARYSSSASTPPGPASDAPVERVVSHVAAGWRTVRPLGRHRRPRHPTHQRALLQWYIAHSAGRALDVRIALSQDTWDAELLLAEVLVHAPRLRRLSIRAGGRGSTCGVRTAPRTTALDQPPSDLDLIVEADFAPVVFMGGAAQLGGAAPGSTSSTRAVRRHDAASYICAPMAYGRFSMHDHVVAGAGGPPPPAPALAALRGGRITGAHAAGAGRARADVAGAQRRLRRVREVVFPALRMLALDGAVAARTRVALLCEFGAVSELRLRCTSTRDGCQEDAGVSRGEDEDEDDGAPAPPSNVGLDGGEDGTRVKEDEGMRGVKGAGAREVLLVLDAVMLGFRSAREGNKVDVCAYMREKPQSAPRTLPLRPSLVLVPICAGMTSSFSVTMPLGGTSARPGPPPPEVEVDAYGEVDADGETGGELATEPVSSSASTPPGRARDAPVERDGAPARGASSLQEPVRERVEDVVEVLRCGVDEAERFSAACTSCKTAETDVGVWERAGEDSVAAACARRKTAGTDMVVEERSGRIGKSALSNLLDSLPPPSPASPATVRLFYGHSAPLLFNSPVVAPLIAAPAWPEAPAAAPRPPPPCSALFAGSASPTRPGVVYIVGRVPTTVWDDYAAGHISLAQLNAAYQIKLGHTKDFPTRRRAYNKCTREHRLIWHATYTTSQRMRLESIVHQYLKAIGAATLPFRCGCLVSHREFFDFNVAGGFGGMDRIVRRCLRALREGNYVSIRNPVLQGHPGRDCGRLPRLIGNDALLTSSCALRVAADAADAP
ncbi:hypothetical protein B0H10DRAFT_1958017 [Mycena sp. CBHHK59/15]|nr:hypothetical protein B0H10DRAFT_1958017 [Mycena sp. CBHHK59/15]